MRIEVRAASASFSGRTVFERFSADFRSNQLSALVGPSGSGKTTLLGAIAGYGGLTEGDVVYVEDDGAAAPPARDQVVWVSQGANALGARSALDNVLLGPLSSGYSLAAARDVSRAALSDVGLGNLANQLARQLSGGELQRLAFARALASGRPIILADEPSSSLDASNTEAIAELLQHLRARATIIVATHDPTLMAVAQHVVDIRARHAA
jgi:putative ABC transport system ATP-binding protein